MGSGEAHSSFSVFRWVPSEGLVSWIWRAGVWGGGRRCPGHDGAEAPPPPVISTSSRLGSPPPPPWAAPIPSARWHHCSDRPLGRRLRTLAEVARCRSPGRGDGQSGRGTSQVGSTGVGSQTPSHHVFSLTQSETLRSKLWSPRSPRLHNRNVRVRVLAYTTSASPGRMRCSANFLGLQGSDGGGAWHGWGRGRGR